MSSVILILLGFSYGETEWRDGKTIGLLVSGGLLLIVACWFETRTTRLAILPKRIFTTRTTVLVLILVFCQGFAFMALSFYGPLYFRESSVFGLA